MPYLSEDSVSHRLAPVVSRVLCMMMSSPPPSLPLLSQVPLSQNKHLANTAAAGYSLSSRFCSLLERERHKGERERETREREGGGLRGKKFSCDSNMHLPNHNTLPAFRNDGGRHASRTRAKGTTGASAVCARTSLPGTIFSSCCPLVPASPSADGVEFHAR